MKNMELQTKMNEVSTNATLAYSAGVKSGLAGRSGALVVDRCVQRDPG